MMYCNNCFNVCKDISVYQCSSRLTHLTNKLEINIHSEQSQLNDINVLYVYLNPTLDIRLIVRDRNNQLKDIKVKEICCSTRDILSWYHQVKCLKFDVIIIDGIFDYLDDFTKIFNYIEQISFLYSKIYINVTHLNILNNIGNIFFSDCKNFWTTNSIKQLCAKNGYLTSDVNIYVNSDYCTYQICKITNNTSEENNIFTLMIDELDRELYSTETYKLFQFKYLIYMNTFLNFILYCKIKNYHIIGCGTKEQIEYFTDMFPDYVQHFDHLVCNSNKFDVIEQIRQNNITDIHVAAVLVIFTRSDFCENFKDSVTTFYSKIHCVDLFDVEKLILTNRLY